MFDRREKSILGWMVVVHCSLIVDFMMIMPQGPQLMRLFQMSAQQFGLLISAYTFGAGFLSLLAAFILDRFDRKPLVIGSFLGFSVGNLACGLASSFSALLLARFVTGAFAGVVGSLIYAIVSDSIDVERRGSALGIVMAAFAPASIVGIPLCLYLSNQIGWHAPYFFLAAFTCAISVLLYRVFPKMSSHLLGRDSDPISSLRQFRSLFSDRSQVFGLLFISCLILGHFSINPFLFPSVVSNAEISETQLPAIYLAGGIASMIASILFGRAADRFGKKAVFSFSLIASLIPIYAVTHLVPMDFTAIALIVTSFFIVMGGRLTPAMALISATSRPDKRGGFLSLVGSVQQLSAALAAFVAGLLVTRTENGKLLGFATVGFMAMGFSLVALFLSRRIVPSEGKNL